MCKFCKLVGHTIQVQEPNQKFSHDVYKVKKVGSDWVELECANGDDMDGEIITVDKQWLFGCKIEKVRA